MNDRAVSVLEEYDLEVLRTWKGRGTILFETKEGICVLKEYNGMTDRLVWQNTLLTHIKEQGDPAVEEILPNKEGELWTKDQDQITYIVKTYPQGRECSIRDPEECGRAMERLAGLHRKMHISIAAGQEINVRASLPLTKEYEKHNRELKRVRKFLRDKSQKSDFEFYLLKNYDLFLEKAVSVSAEWKQYCERKAELPTVSKDVWCHGDYQHHNIIVENDDMYVINFEKCGLDSQVRDVYLFFRKFLEKTNWSTATGEKLLKAYERENPLNAEDRAQLYYRLLYPEKFWKIVNFYYNAGRSWLPGKNIEKFEKLLRQEDEKERFLKELFG